MIWRLGSAKQSGELDLTWADVADILNAEFRPDEPYQESAYRKQFQMANLFYETVFAKQIGGDNFIEQLREERQELYKIKTQVRDERNELNRKLRDEARLAQSFEMMSRTIEEYGRVKYSPIPHATTRGETDVLCCISDVHYGIEFDSHTGKYNSGIARKRLQQYACEVIEIGKRHCSESVYVTLLGDLVSGNIHRQISVENRENLIEQIIGVSEAIADFIFTLTTHYVSVHINSVGGNHSRIHPKDIAVKDERLDNLVVWHLQSKFSHMRDKVFVTPLSSNLDSTVAVFNIREKNYVSVHGDYDPFTDAGLSKLILWLGFTPYAIITAHRHTLALKDVFGVICIQSASLSGSGDDYTVENRLRGEPGQSVCVLSRRGVEAMYPVKFE